ncbi:hypothetical protein L211DRAFT_832948 [Terfezia boudieri ATCC MYA-4762]|uniref:Glycosyltransferase family 1 protein n=1 Tax=Terfezia boudieri ATCC MYA-4762 TaxID=1051890 RepID=A0A3N4M1M9_9PEZI|nr:hypothetical protein L211DRAFT_832948 [Terfezia boudieri ATCC MYA-4762]
MRRRLSLLLLLGILFVLITTSIFFSDPIRGYIPKTTTGPVTAPPGSLQEPPSHSNVDTTTKVPQTKFDGAVHIALTETGGSHDEVVAAFVHSFASQPRVQMDIYQLLPRFGIKDIMASFDLPSKPSGPNDPSDFLSWKKPEQKLPDIWVATTCEIDLLYYQKNLTMLLENGKTYIYCVIHHADRWNNQKVKNLASQWVEQSRIEFVTLSPHTAEYLQKEGVGKWRVSMPPLIRYLVPIFPVSITSEESTQKQTNGENAPLPMVANEELSFALQGDYDPSRRDYTSLFSRLDSFLSGGNYKDLTMHLLGHGDNKPIIPDTIKPHVQFNERLSYIEYYSLIARTFALLPAFASVEYLDRKASSTIPAALIAGVPLVATKEMVQAYGYLNMDVVWEQEVGRSDIDVVGDVLKMTVEERRRKKQAVRESRDEIIKGNTRRVGEWLQEAMRRMGREL